MLLLAIAATSRAASYHVKRLATGFHLPVYATTAPGDDDRIFVVQLGGLASHETDGDPNTSVLGKIMIYNRSTGSVNSEPFLVVNDTSAVDPVTSEPEVGLWALAFHPDYENNGRFFINVAVDTPAQGPFSSMIREHSVSANPNIANQSATKLVMQIDQPAFNHNGSWMGFNPIANDANDDKQYLYITLGDGGDQHDPRQYGQGLDELFGSVLRIDVDSPSDPGLNYHIPESNPFVGETGARGEVWNYGLRNPWQASFDRATGDFWISDVGQGSYEEINYQPASSTGGENYGWRPREGDVATPTGGIGGPLPPGAVDPIYAYGHFGLGTAGFEGNSVAGGRLYRGPVEEFQGRFVFADSRSGEVWDFDPADPYGTARRTKLLPGFTPGEGEIDYVVSISEDNQGNLLIVDYDGELFQLLPNLAVTASIDRETGGITFANLTGEAIGIRGYSITSASGAIDPAMLDPIAGRLDNSASGNGDIDSNNTWQVTSQSDDHTLFSEESTGGAASFSDGQGFTLSDGDAWIQSIYEDLQLNVILEDGSVVPAIVDFVGNGSFANPFERSDLNFNGELDPGDWIQFRSHHLDEMTGLSLAESYQLGDLDGDGDNDFTDFRLFQANYVAAHGEAAFAAILRVPEPGSAMLCIVAVIGSTLPIHRRLRRRWLRTRLFPVVRRGPLSVRAIALLILTFLIAERCQAELRHLYTFNDGTAKDSVATAHGTLMGSASVGLGLLDLPGGTNDFVSLPASQISINNYVDTTFEAWFTWHGGGNWQRVFDFGRTNFSGQGRDYIFYTPHSGSGDNRAAITDDGAGQENVADGGPSLAIGSEYHVAVVVDDASNGGTGQLSLYVNGTLADSTNLTHSLSDVSNSLAYLGRSMWSDPFFNGQIDEFRIHDNALQAADVLDSFQTGPLPLDLLGLDVNTVTGQTALVNRAGAPLTFDYYRLESDESAIDVSGWTSLDEQNVDAVGAAEGESWDKLGQPYADLITEAFVLGATTLAPGESLDLGHAFDPSVRGLGADGELSFRFALQGKPLRSGVVNYITPDPLSGDYNGDSTVDAADYTVWRDALGTSIAAADGDGDGMVDHDDYVIWKWSFGNSAEGGGAVSKHVPEPSAATLLLMCIVVLTHRSVASPSGSRLRLDSRTHQIAME
jgi:hypothetical protein